MKLLKRIYWLKDKLKGAYLGLIYGESDLMDRMKDHLTGLPQRQELEEVFKKEQERARRHNHSLSLVLLDVDNLKQINDNHGHPKGDKALKKMAEIIESNIRLPDYAFRWGGDEFIILLPETNGEEAKAVIQRLKREFSKTSLENEEIELSFSAGWIEYNKEMNSSHPISLDYLINVADKRMYKQKRGRL